MRKSYSIKIIEKNCKQCGICSNLCVKQVLEQKLGSYPAVANPSACIGCLMCQMRCPDFAIEVEFPRPESGKRVESLRPESEKSGEVESDEAR